MTENNPFGRNPSRQGRPWFRPRQMGLGYVPQTWQGFALSGLCVAFVIVMALVTGGHSPLMAIAIIPFGVIFAIGAFQNRQ